MVRRFFLALILAAGLGTFWVTPQWAPAVSVEAQAIAGPIPSRLTDQQFWGLVTRMSEPDGYFRSENLVSNEHTFQYVVPPLARRVQGGVYLGVAPDQNFTYIAAVKPRMAFIVDIRRGNLLQHLMYKALIEMSADRAEFVSRLFSRARPQGLDASATAEAIFSAYDRVPASDALYRENLNAINERLVTRHAFRLSIEDLQQLEGIYWQFFWEGPGIRYTTSSPVPGRGGSGRRGFGMTFPTYADLVQQTDWEGRNRSYLASEATVAFLKDFQERNLLVPIVGDFAGPKALRAVGRYVRDHGETVSAFYVSNVEQYLFQSDIWPAFYRNVATLPVTESSTFIRSVSNRMGYNGPMMWTDGRATALDPIRASVRDFLAGRISRYYDLNARWK
jgi:hypothetical protein